MGVDLEGRYCLFMGCSSLVEPDSLSCESGSVRLYGCTAFECVQVASH